MCYLVFCDFFLDELAYFPSPSEAQVKEALHRNCKLSGVVVRPSKHGFGLFVAHDISVRKSYIIFVIH